MRRFLFMLVLYFLSAAPSGRKLKRVDYEWSVIPAGYRIPQADGTYFECAS